MSGWLLEEQVQTSFIACLDCDRSSLNSQCVKLKLFHLILRKKSNFIIDCHLSKSVMLSEDVTLGPSAARPVRISHMAFDVCDALVL